MIATSAVLGLMLVSASGCQFLGAPPIGVDSAVGEVTADGLALNIRGAAVVVPAGAAPVSTVVTLEDAMHEFPYLENYAVPLRDPIALTLGDGKQPTAPLIIELAVDRDRLVEGEWSDDSTMVIMSQSADGGEVELIPAVWNSRESSLTAEVSHLSFFQPIQIDLGALWSDAFDAALKAWRIESPKPDCVGQEPTINGVTFSVIQPWPAWVCLGDEGGDLVAQLTANAPIPFAVTTSGPSTIVSLPSLGATDLASQVFFDAVSPAGSGLLAPGGQVRIELDGRQSATVRMDQQPAMLIASLLLTLLDLVLPSSVSQAAMVDKLNAAGCIEDIVGASTVNELNSDFVGAVLQAFFPCAQFALSDIPIAGKIVLAILSGAPLFFSGFVIGAINEITGRGAVSFEITAGRPVWVDCGPARATPQYSFQTPTGSLTICESAGSSSGYLVDSVLGTFLLTDLGGAGGNVCGSTSDGRLVCTNFETSVYFFDWPAGDPGPRDC